MEPTPRYVVSVSSGLGSAYAWHLTRQEHPDSTTGLFADVNGEDDDNYRFLAEIHLIIGGPLVTLDNDGQTIWDVFRTVRFLGNSRADPCSRILKREAILGWLTDNRDPADTTVVLGVDWTEENRFLRARDRWAADGWTVTAPLCDRGYDKGHIDRWLHDIGVARPRLYDLGFAHANCGGGCVRMGHRQAKHLLRVRPATFAEWERRENEHRAEFGDVAMLRHRSGPKVGKPLSLTELRLLVEAQPALFDGDEWGACGCFTGFETAAGEA